MYLSNLDYRGPYAQQTPAEERQAFEEMWAGFVRLGKPVGMVRIYILDPAGQPYELPLVGLSRTAAIETVLRGVAERFQVQPGPPLAAPRNQSRPPGRGREDLALHLVARGFREGSWREFPAENWIVLTPGDQAKLLPPGEFRRGISWTVDSALARRILRHVHPQTEDPDEQDRNQYLLLELRIKVLEVKGGEAWGRIDGSVAMNRSFYPARPVANHHQIRARLAGWVEWEVGRRRVLSLAMATTEAYYGNEEFGVAARTLGE